jgi:hypothetical protein
MHFDLSATITTDREREVGPERHRAFYRMSPTGQVSVTRVEVDNRKPGNPELWQPCVMPWYVIRELEGMIEQDIEDEEQKLIAAMEEEEYAHG